MATNSAAYQSECNDALDNALSEVEDGSADCPNCGDVLFVSKADEGGSSGTARCDSCGKRFRVEVNTDSDGVCTAVVTSINKKRSN
jgi:predicted Zn finger-like uncharacterized protein